MIIVINFFIGIFIIIFLLKLRKIMIIVINLVIDIFIIINIIIILINTFIIIYYCRKLPMNID